MCTAVSRKYTIPRAAPTSEWNENVIYFNIIIISDFFGLQNCNNSKLSKKLSLELQRVINNFE